MNAPVIRQGTLAFSIESRILRELGERLVKQPEVAIVELIKNSYDADATECTVSIVGRTSISVIDNGSGMTLDRFIDGWMRIGTSIKLASEQSAKFFRPITGEKGIGRFAVRFLGDALHLESVAEDPITGSHTRLVADFDWPEFDRNDDLTSVDVPYRLETSDPATSTGTTLIITPLRFSASQLHLNKVRTSSIDVLSPLGALLQQAGSHIEGPPKPGAGHQDPGFVLRVEGEASQNEDVASAILGGFTLRSCLRLTADKLDLRVYRRHDDNPYLAIVDTFPNHLQHLHADIRFFPRRSGAFRDLPIDGRKAYTWVAENAGVAVFDRRFRVAPYGMESDHWLLLDADAARNRRDPRSSISSKHFPMSEEERASTSDNWMLRLPQSAQLIGAVSVDGRRLGASDGHPEKGLIASADREGFVENTAFRQLQDLVRGAVEAIAYCDRRIQQEEEKRRRDALVSAIREETQEAIREIQANPNISASDKSRIVESLALTQRLADLQEATTRERENQLEVMSLLGVVAGFMTHEFGVAITELTATHALLAELGRHDPRFVHAADGIATHIGNLQDFVTYSSGYIQGAKAQPHQPYPARPRITQIERIFGRYAADRGIDLEIEIPADLMAPLVPVSLYNGLSLNLFTNALKAVTAKHGSERGLISFRAWNDRRWHYLEVLDNGVGIPTALRDRVFDALFTTTDSRNDPLGSGMGLGLTLVRRSVQSFGGRVDVVDPPPRFATCVRVRLPVREVLENE